MNNPLSKQEIDEQIQLHELMGRNVLNYFLNKKQNIQLTHKSDFKLKEHWDVCLLSASTLNMITELKVNYWQSNNSGYTAGIKLKKYSELIQLSKTPKAIEKGSLPFIIFFHFNGVWIANLKDIESSIINKEGKVSIQTRIEEDATAYNNGKKEHTYLTFDLNHFGEYFNIRFNYKDLRALTLQQGKKLINPSLCWKDKKHLWIDG